MSDDSYTEVTETSWFSRIKSAFVGIVFGLILFLAAFPLLFWNEGRAVKRYKSLKEGSGIVVSVQADRVDPEQEGGLVHVTGLATTEETLTDPQFRGVASNALKLKRRVEMYQWEENTRTKTEKKVGGGERKVTEYYYERTWSERPIDSSRFKKPDSHRNPGAMPVHSESFTARKSTLGAYTLTPTILSDISAYRPVSPDESAPAPSFQGIGGCNVSGNGYFCGGSPDAPQVGDLRIRFEAVPPTVVSIVARQQGDTFTAYQTEAGGTLLLVETGTHTARAMFKTAETRNKWLTWAIRVGGFILMMIGLTLMFKPISVFADVLPFLGNIVEFGTGLLAFFIAGILSFITIAVAWFVYRPLLGAILVGGAILLIVAMFMMFRKKKAAHVPAAAPPSAPPRLPAAKPPTGPPAAAPPPPIGTGAAPPPPPGMPSPPPDSGMTADEWMVKGQGLFKEGRSAEAIDAFSKAIALAPDNAATYYNRGILYMKNGSEAESIDDFKAAARLGHEKAQAYLNSKGMDW